MKIVSHAWADQRGFTFTEFMVAVAVLALIMTGLASIIVSGNQTYVAGSGQIEAQQAARVVLEQLVRDVRGAGYNPTGAPCPPNDNCPVLGVASALVIQNDTNADGVFAATERIGYALFGTTLLRQDFAVNATPQTIMRGIQALTFTYLDENGNAVTEQPEAIRSVRISLTAQPANQYAGKASVTMSDTIRLRNR